MQNNQQGDRLSWGDTVFLHLEREGMPLNVACVCVFEGEISFEACVQFVESKLPLIPRYLKRVVPPLLNIGLPSWEYDPTFDIRRHVREVTLKHGSDTELKTLAGKTSEHGDGPATPAMGHDPGAWAERQSQRTHLPPAPLPRRWHRRGRDHECAHGCEPGGACVCPSESSGSESHRRVTF